MPCAASWCVGHICIAGLPQKKQGSILDTKKNMLHFSSLFLIMFNLRAFDPVHHGQNGVLGQLIWGIHICLMVHQTGHDARRSALQNHGGVEGPGDVQVRESVQQGVNGFHTARSSRHVQGMITLNFLTQRSGVSVEQIHQVPRKSSMLIFVGPQTFTNYLKLFAPEK